jgi:hypothetical protein
VLAILLFKAYHVYVAKSPAHVQLVEFTADDLPTPGQILHVLGLDGPKRTLFLGQIHAFEESQVYVE